MISAPIEQHGTLDLERYAVVLAHTCYFPPDDLAELLVRLDVAPEDWEAACNGWRAALAEEVRCEETRLALEFGSFFSATRRRLKRERPALSSIGSLPEGTDTAAEAAGASSAPAAEPALIAPAIPPISMAPRVELPSYMLAATAPTTSPVVPRALASAPFPRTTPVPAPPPRINPAPLDLRGTSMSLDLPRRAALPFQAGGAPEQVLADVIARMTAAQGALPAEGEKPPRAHLGETVGVAPLPVGKVLPFAAGTTKDGGLTVAPALSIERYASLCVELAATPGNAAQTLRRYQLSEPEWVALDAYWKARFSREPEARSAWESARAAYRAWLARVDPTKK
jgi:hypothetical protein